MKNQHGESDDKSKKSSFSAFRNKDGISSIHSNNDIQPMAGADVHYLMDVPSPRFSSNIGDDVEEDEEKNEIIRCILH